MRRRITPVLIALLAAVAADARAGDPVPNPLRGGDVQALLTKAAEMKSKDAAALAAALADLSADRKDRGGDLEFTVEYVTRETDRGMRFLALEAARRIDRKGAAERFRAKLAEKDSTRVTLAAEALGHVGSADDVPALLATMKGPSEMAASAAATALARVAGTKDVDAIVEAALGHSSDHVTDHGAWAVQDLLKKPKSAVERFQKVASKKSDPRSIRAAATVAMLEDDLAEPFRWSDSLAMAHKLLTAVPDSVPVKGSSSDGVKSTQAAIAWLEQNLPAQARLFRAAVRQVNVPGASADSRLNPDADAVEVPLSEAFLEPKKLAYLLVQRAGVIFQKRILEPWKGHRGWEAPLFDAYDVCVVGKMYDAGPGGLTREMFLADRLAARPWGGQ